MQAISSLALKCEYILCLKLGNFLFLEKRGVFVSLGLIQRWPFPHGENRMDQQFLILAGLKNHLVNPLICKSGCNTPGLCTVFSGGGAQGFVSFISMVSDGSQGCVVISLPWTFTCICPLKFSFPDHFQRLISLVWDGSVVVTHGETGLGQWKRFPVYKVGMSCTIMPPGMFLLTSEISPGLRRSPVLSNLGPRTSPISNNSALDQVVHGKHVSVIKQNFSS